MNTLAPLNWMQKARERAGGSVRRYILEETRCDYLERDFARSSEEASAHNPDLSALLA